MKLDGPYMEGFFNGRKPFVSTFLVFKEITLGDGLNNRNVTLLKT
jgi:hypothetical protein